MLEPELVSPFPGRTARLLVLLVAVGHALFAAPHCDVALGTAVRIQPPSQHLHARNPGIPYSEEYLIMPIRGQ